MHHISLEIALLLVWVAATGGAIGSFLNVVVYRLPAGMSLVHPGSHCPLCGHPIRWYDNMPVLGWILLGGRCRDCHAPISVRYPLIEGLTMAMFVVVAVYQWIVPGGDTPWRSYPVSGGFVTPPLSLYESAIVYAYRMFLMCTLLVVALIEYDGKQLPRRVGIPALAVGVLGACFWPFVHPVATIPSLDGWLSGLIDAGSGLAAGVLGGMLASFIVDEQDENGFFLASALTGLFLGWQAAALLTLLCIVEDLRERRWSWRRGAKLPPSIWWPGWAMLWILGGHHAVECCHSLVGR